MTMDYERYEPVAASTRRSLPRLLIIPLLAFLIGIAAMGWLLTRWDGAARLIGLQERQQPVKAAPAPQPAATAQPDTKALDVTADTETVVLDPETTRRVTQLEGRLGQLETQSRAAVGNADRAEGLLVAFAARRALDRGVRLGYLEGLLRDRFAQSQPQAVATIITAAGQPVTLEELREGLQGAGPALTGAGPEQSWWSAFRSEMSGLVTLRRQGTISTQPEARLRRATRALDSGQVDVALAEVLRMPGYAQAPDWIAKARRYVDARRALDTIETAALLEPREIQPVTTPAKSAAQPKAQPKN